MTRYTRLKATTRADAIRDARSLCRCARMSSAGVEWTDAVDGIQRLSWAEVDGAG